MNISVYDEDIEKKETIRDNHGCSCATDFTLICPYCNKKLTIRDTCDLIH